MVKEIQLSKRGKNAGKYIAIVDDCDAELAEITWAVLIKSDSLQYAFHVIYSAPHVHLQTWFLHRVILERKLERPLEKGECPDHINGNGLDNRRENLRVSTQSQNNANRKQSQATAHKYKGALWHKKSSTWRSQIKLNSKSIHLGTFDTDLDAHRAYCIAAVKYHGEFANFGANSPFTPDMFKPKSPRRASIVYFGGLTA